MTDLKVMAAVWHDSFLQKTPEQRQTAYEHARAQYITVSSIVGRMSAAECRRQEKEWLKLRVLGAFLYGDLPVADLHGIYKEQFKLTRNMEVAITEAHETDDGAAPELLARYAEERVNLNVLGEVWLDNYEAASGT